MLHPHIEFIIDELTHLRIEAGMSQNELARKMESSPNTIRNWENKTNDPSGSNLVRWAEILGYEFDLHPIERKRKNYV